MPQDIHALLDECRSKTEALVNEIQQYKASRELNQAATEGLEEIREALEQVITEIEPFSEVRSRRFQTLMLSGSGLIILLLITNLLLLIFRS